MTKVPEYYEQKDWEDPIEWKMDWTGPDKQVVQIPNLVRDAMTPRPEVSPPYRRTFDTWP
ncbi:uncharacterized protein ACLA_030790 [Aspergillus clavatus NRRL 1]|uniref:Uncharacterized protein n=1 Tax=Aspergillus clavatus (strain ATCC 1007 / CBS 513.65 / DSM 816 / NCTC 3887 / NRRL 1 / QM 1276 / 107) TaxID=344612 RepID=A1CRS5_ASPCL|nr:uncharacterized protein ACLA_030790 [Aspergillus clavatus NRRL 1]EAW08346.1 hypothetical protein ACLA_030790 [Aspergillus clavatus NRRL 1]